MGEHIQAALHEQLRRKGQLLGLPFRLPLDIVAPVGQGGLPGFAAAFDKVAVDVGGTSVDDGFMKGPQLARTHLLLANAHHQLGFHSDWVLTGAVAFVNGQRVEMVGTVGGNLQHSPMEGTGQLPVLPFRVDDNNIIFRGQGDKGDSFFHGKGLAGAGHAQNKAVGIQQLLSVADQQVFGDSVDAIVDAPGILDLLNTERCQDGGALRSQSTGSLDPP